MIRSLRWGDAVVVALAALVVTASFSLTYSAATGPTQLVVTRAGAEPQTFALHHDHSIRIEGPAGITEIEIRGGRARCLHSPGSQGICQGAGWLERDGDMAVSLPNRLVLQVSASRPSFDSMHY